MDSRVELRDWQRDSIARYMAKGSANYLQVATPGAGKTTFALETACRLKESGVVERLVIVVPTSHLRRQWRSSAQRMGLKISATFTNGDQMLAGDYDGMAVTYQAVAAFPTLYRIISSQKPTLVVFDEIHHAGDRKGWGEAVRDAFSEATRRLAISGTPFRTRGERIPFVRYDEEGRLVPDDTYNYDEALRDGICREIYFHTFEGEFEWEQVREGNRSAYAATFADDLDPNAESARLRTALSTEADWLPNVIREADRRLRSIRDHEFADAGGLIIAMDREHALRIAKLVKKHIGEAPLVAISENPEDDSENPSDIIRRFADGDEDATGVSYRDVPRWLVAVKMVSEGVDIPRLCVGVYATNVTAELAFRQAVGRYVRTLTDAPGVSAALFVPKDRRLVAHMERIREEVEVFVREEKDREGSDQDSGDRKRPTYEAIRAEAMADNILIGDEVYSREFIASVRQFQIEQGLESMALELALKFYRAAEKSVMARMGTIETTPVEHVVRQAERSLDEEKEAIKARINKAVGRLMRVTDVEHRSIHANANHLAGIRAQATAELEQLEEKLRILQQWEEEAMQHGR